ncbi:MAG: hypothetical protein AAFV85_12410 [Cyanobacteria bacterium J06634_6]
MAFSFIDRDSTPGALIVDNQLDQELTTAIRRKVRRQAGARLDSTFLSMAPHVIDETQVQTAFLSVEGHQLEGVRYQGQVYRKVEEFQLCHRLQSYCLAKTLSEQQLAYIMTRSDKRFAVWVSIQEIPKGQLC